MTPSFRDVFGAEKPLIGVVHLGPLPGSPGSGGDLEPVLEAALADACLLSEGGVHGLVLENFGDAPFFPDRVPVETVAAMTFLATRVREIFPGPLGINVLRNDGRSAVAIAHAVGGQFVRVNVLTGSAYTDQGLIEGKAHRILRLRRALGAAVTILADVQVKHATPVPGSDLVQLARDTWERGGADALIVTGKGTGEPSALEDVRTLKAAIPEAPVLVGSGITAATAGVAFRECDGAIVGTALKAEGRTRGAVELERVQKMMKAWSGGGSERGAGES